MWPVHYQISECALCAFSAFLAKNLRIFFWVANGVSVLLYGVFLYGVHKVSTVEELV